MKPSPFEFARAPEDAPRTEPQRSEVAVRAEMRASPPGGGKQSPAGDDPPEEPGYGHGV